MGGLRRAGPAPRNAPSNPAPSCRALPALILAAAAWVLRGYSEQYSGLLAVLFLYGLPRTKKIMTAREPDYAGRGREISVGISEWRHGLVEKRTTGTAACHAPSPVVTYCGTRRVAPR